MNEVDRFYQQAFNRNIGLLTEDEQKRLRQARVAIVGMGGVGGFHLTTLARLGVGRFSIADMDSFEPANIQRQCGAYSDTMGKNKAEVMKGIALSINPHLEMRVFAEGVNKDNLDSFLDGAEVFIDGIDFFSIDERRLIFRRAAEKGAYAITAGPLGFGSAMLVFKPGGMTFDEYFDLNDRMSYEDKIIAFGIGLAPASVHMSYLKLEAVDLQKKTGPSLVSACNLSSVLAATETLNVLLRRNEPLTVPHYMQFDPFARRLKTGYLWLGNRNPIQRLKRALARRYFVKRNNSK